MKTFTAVLTCGLLLGCGGSGSDGPTLFPVTGTVTLDGNPLPDAQVLFLSDATNVTAVGQTDASGKYTLTTKGEPGAVAGNHKVSVVSAATGGGPPPEEGSEEYAKMMAGEAPKAESPIPAKYSLPKTSALTATVTEGENDIPLELKK